MSGPVSPLVTQQSCLGISTEFMCQDSTLRTALPSSLVLVPSTHHIDREVKAPKTDTKRVMKQGLSKTRTCIIWVRHAWLSIALLMLPGIVLWFWKSQTLPQTSIVWLRSHFHIHSPPRCLLLQSYRHEEDSPDLGPLFQTAENLSHRSCQFLSLHLSHERGIGSGQW